MRQYSRKSAPDYNSVEHRFKTNKAVKAME